MSENGIYIVIPPKLGFKNWKNDDQALNVGALYFQTSPYGAMYLLVI
jgi:hypothetical protein